MFAVATSFFARTAISQSYSVGNAGSRSSTPGPASTSGSSAPAQSSPPILIGLWKVQEATHKVTHKKVSVWSFDKRGPEMERLGPLAKERTLEVLKGEASALSRLRHPSILEMVEPLEETRSELIFATEPVLASLDLAIPNAGRYASLVELDEVEIQKGILQLCKGLSFLHTSAKSIHSNLCPQSIIINSSGDWKMSGLGLTIPLLQPNGSPTRWEFPTFDGRVPAYIQRDFDYMAPEYALDEQLVTASDLYSLGCVIYAVHSKGNPPFKTHGSLSGLREAMAKGIGGIQGFTALEYDLQNLLSSLLSRHPNSRPTSSSLPTHGFFSSLPISTLNFLDRSNFSTKSREEKIGFMKGLSSVLDRFTENLKTRKILPSLLEEMKDTHLLPYILPNVFSISTALSSSQFAIQVLPSLKPLFAVKEPPQNMLTLLDNLEMLRTKTDKNVFRTEVLPLVYNALDSEHAVVQERALKTVPDLCETIDYADTAGVLFPRVALVFTKTRVLSVKVATLKTFQSMVKTLDQSNLTQKLVPLLSKIRTKEPAVMMATLSVQEAMGFKVDREAVATLVIPQLWSLSVGPLLNLEQFQRFMEVIRKLGDRVEKEHNQFLRDSQRIEDRSATSTTNGNPVASFAGTVDFQTLVASNSATANAAASSTTTANGKANGTASWEDDVWGSIFNDTPSSVQTPAIPAIAPSPPAPQSQSLPSSPRINTFQAKPSRLGASRMPSQTSNTSFSSPVSQTPAIAPPLKPISPPPPLPNLAPRNGSAFSVPLAQAQLQHQKPNYNISLDPIASSNTGMMFPQSTGGMSAMTPTMTPSVLAPTTMAAPHIGMGMRGLLMPSKPPQPQKTSQSNVDWGDFDPLA